MRPFLHCTRGAAALEFALVFPMLFALFLGGVELSRYTMFQQKLEKSTAALADLATQSGSLTRQTLDELAKNMDMMMKPFTFGGSIIFTGVVNASAPTGICRTPGQPCIAWQYRPTTGATMSRFGLHGDTPALPGGYRVQLNQNVVAVEVFDTYTPIFSAIGNAFNPLLRTQTLYVTAVYKPRQLGTLTTLD